MLRMRGEGSAPLLFRAADNPAVLDSPRVQRSRSFGFAETVSKHFAVRGLASGWHVAGVRWVANDRSLITTCLGATSTQETLQIHLAISRILIALLHCHCHGITNKQPAFYSLLKAGLLDAELIPLSALFLFTLLGQFFSAFFGMNENIIGVSDVLFPLLPDLAEPIPVLKLKRLNAFKEFLVAFGLQLLDETGQEFCCF